MRYRCNSISKRLMVPAVLMDDGSNCMVPTADSLPTADCLSFAQAYSDLSDRYDWKKGMTEWVFF